MNFAKATIKTILIINLILTHHVIFAQQVSLKKNANLCRDLPEALCTEQDSLSGTIGNAKFQLFSDESGSVQGDKVIDSNYKDNWRLSCIKDAISRKISCNISKSSANLSIWLSPKGEIRVYVGDDHYPGSQTSIRINDHVFHTESEYAFSKSKTITTLMRDGSQMVTKYTAWPYRNAVTSQFDIFGFQAALKISLWASKNIE